MSNNTNPFPEISALVLAVLLIIGGVFLLYVGKIDYSNSVFFFVSALGLLGFSSAIKAPSSAQTSQINALVSQLQSQSAAQPPIPITIHNNMPPAPAPAPLPLPPAQPAQPAQEFVQRYAPDLTLTSIDTSVQPAMAAGGTYSPPQQFAQLTRNFTGMEIPTVQPPAQ